MHLVADGVSSVNKEEIPIAFERLRQAGAAIGTSESIAFQLQRRFYTYLQSTFIDLTNHSMFIVDSAKPNFKLFANTIKEEKERTKGVLQTLLPGRAGL